jgi:nitroreductase
MELLDGLQWRYATKRYKSNVKIAEDKVMQIVETARMAPTSSGLQPFEIILIKNQDLKEELMPICMNQNQIKECSHLLVFAAWDSYTESRIDAVFDNMENIREMERGTMNDYKKSIKENFARRTKEQQFEHAARQTYLAFGLAIGAAAELRVDASPMEGFYNDKLNQALRLDKRGLKSVTLLALGERDIQNDWLAPMKKVRFDLDKILTVIE